MFQVNIIDNEQYETVPFKAKQELSSSEIVSDLYKKVNGWAFDTANPFKDTPLDEILEKIDILRMPLAEKRMEGVRLTNREFIYLSMLDSLTDQILSSFSKEQEEPLDVKLALEIAARVGKVK
jgi:hypothetical protein